MLTAAERFFQVCNQVVGIPGLDDHIIHVGFNVPMQLISKAHLDRALISRSCVFQPKGHSFVSLCPEQGDERGFDLIFLLERNVVISRITIKEAEDYTTRRQVDDLINAR
jgi:hypothetical protein